MQYDFRWRESHDADGDHHHHRRRRRHHHHYCLQARAGGCGRKVTSDKPENKTNQAKPSHRPICTPPLSLGRPMMPGSTKVPPARPRALFDEDLKKKVMVVERKERERGSRQPSLSLSLILLFSLLVCKLMDALVFRPGRPALLRPPAVAGGWPTAPRGRTRLNKDTAHQRS